MGEQTGVKDINGRVICKGHRAKNERGEIGRIVFSRGAFVSEYEPPYNWDPMEPVDGLLERQEIIGEDEQGS